MNVCSYIERHYFFKGIQLGLREKCFGMPSHSTVMLKNCFVFHSVELAGHQHLWTTPLKNPIIYQAIVDTNHELLALCLRMALQEQRP